MHIIAVFDIKIWFQLIIDSHNIIQSLKAGIDVEISDYRKNSRLHNNLQEPFNIDRAFFYFWGLPLPFSGCHVKKIHPAHVCNHIKFVDTEKAEME